MADITFNVSAFRAQCPEFSDVSRYPNATLLGYWEAAACTISPTDYGTLSGDSRARALNLLTAHLAALFDKIAAGETAGVVTAAGVDKVTVTMAPPPVKSQFQWWLTLTPRGAQLQALLSAKAVGGFYVGGRSEIGAFRRSGGW